MFIRLSKSWRGGLTASFSVAHLSLLYVFLYAILITTSPYGLFAQYSGGYGDGLDGTFGSSGISNSYSGYEPGQDSLADGEGSSVEFDASELEKANCELMMVMKGSLGSLLATVAGIGAVFAGALGMYSAAWTFVIVACSAFIIESIVTLWFPMPTGCEERLFVDILDWATCRLLFVVEDMIGNLVATLAGIGAIVSCVIGAYKAAWAFLFTALGGFLLRSFVGFFFEDNIGRCLGSVVNIAGQSNR
ncbi:hypothetical protein BVY02_00980 [bacterium J17]|nr:hypothetical protein BVY02_00980 [bacterium J17]